ncbi:uncharacterized protein [Cebidichthys violaceus]|uniref:uncharacterized protein n=1 Tax=Cebidichthys violaceus TaxID=271503 RepID=UPI0035CC7308
MTRPHVIRQQNSPQMAQSQCFRSGCVGFRVQRRTVEHHTALVLARGLQVLCGSICQDSLEGCGPVHPHPQALTHYLPTSHGENPTATEGQYPGHHCWRDLGSAELSARTVGVIRRGEDSSIFSITSTRTAYTTVMGQVSTFVSTTVTLLREVDASMQAQEDARLQRLMDHEKEMQNNLMSQLVAMHERINRENHERHLNLVDSILSRFLQVADLTLPVWVTMAYDRVIQRQYDPQVTRH